MSSRADESERLYDILRALGLKPSTDDSRDRIPGAEIDICRAAPYPRENDTVFLAVSVGSAPPKTAAEERRALALGCAWLDTRTLDGLPPGSKGASWIAKAESYAYAVAGRQCEAEARGLTADWESTDLRDITPRRLCRWLHTGTEPGRAERRRCVMISMRIRLVEKRSSERHGRAWTRCKTSYETNKCTSLTSCRPGIVDAFNLVDFYNTLKREGDLHHAPLDGMYGTMGLSIAHTLDVKERAYRMLAATIAISLEAAAASTSVAPPAARSRIDFAGPIAPRVRSEAWDIPLPVSSLDLELQRSLPADYDDSSFTKDDQSTTICDGTQVIRRPVRIEHRVARYSEMSDHLANWLITYAQQHAYPNLSTIVSRRKHCRGRRISIKAPVGQNYELLARNLVSHLAIPDSVSQYIDEIVQLRTFVSTWYESMQRSDPSSETSEVARSTERHRAFVGVLENLRLFLCGS
ncbi:hypothetical protein LTR35_009177 [Friedmanniomyces endolithicus]|nr:hypothetical protein LTR35_009177 [Friedmanniomyces endolithicus]